MTRTTLLLSFVAAAALAGCESEPVVVGGPADDPSNQVPATNAANVQLPPSIAASKTYRCKDNSLIKIDWLSDGSARVAANGEGLGEPVQVGEGGPLKGTSQDASVTYNGQSCKA